jgi:hypothetical protein
MLEKVAGRIFVFCPVALVLYASWVVSETRAGLRRCLTLDR